MPKFKHSFINFSKGEVSDKNVNVYASPDDKAGVSYLENAFTTKTNGIKRRTGTLVGPKLNFPVDSENKDVFTFPFYVDEENSFLGVMYSVLSTDLDEPVKSQFETDANIQAGSRGLVIEIFKFDGENFTFFNRLQKPMSYSDVSLVASNFTFNDLTKNFSEDWVTMEDYNFSRYRNIGIFTHGSGKVEKFCLFFNGTSFEFSSFKNMLLKTDPGNYPTEELSWVGTLPITPPNTNPEIGINVRTTNASTTQSFRLKARITNAGTLVDYSTVVSYDGQHPFAGISNIIRLNILGKSYYLQYTGTITGSTSFQYLFDPSDTTDPDYDDEILCRLILDQPGSDALATVVNTTTGIDVTDFQVEEFWPQTSHPSVSEIYSQRLVVRNDAKLFNSATGNLFFLNQYRISGSPTRITSYTGVKIDSDPFDFSPIQKDYSRRSWLSTSRDILELGGFSNILNIRGTEDNVYSFTSVRSDLGTTEGSLKSISEKISDFTLFVGENNVSLRDYRYDGRVRAYVSNDLNRLNPSISEHNYTGSNPEELSIKNIAVDTSNDLVYLSIKPSGAVISMRYSFSDAISSWSRFTLGDEISSPAVIYSSAYVKLGNRSGGVTAFITERNSDFYIEFLSESLSVEDANPTTRKIGYGTEDLFSYLDFSTRFVDSTAKRVWDLGETYQRRNIDVVADGYLISNVGIGPDGILTLDRDVNTVVVGYAYNTRIRFLPIEPSQSQIGDSLGDLKHIHSVHLRLHNSYGGEIKIEGSDYADKIPYDSDNMIVGTSLNMFTGYVEISPEICSSEDLRVQIDTDRPYPFEISAAIVKGEVNDG